MDDRIIEYLVSESPGDKETDITNILVGLIETHDPTWYRHATMVIRKYKLEFTDPMKERIVAACRNSYNHVSGDDFNDLEDTVKVLSNET